MDNVYLIDDFPGNIGGSELVNKTVADYFGIKILKSSTLKVIDPKAFYIVSNISTMSELTTMKLAMEANYIILEHDYKFVSSRHPWRYKDSIVPEAEKVNTLLYKNAKAVFVQSEDHLNVFKANNINGNFINLECSIWSDKELDLLLKYYNETPKKNYKACVVNSSNWIKNTQGCKQICNVHKLDYDVIEPSNPEEFLKEIAQYSMLVFFPIARETLCRLLVEARCMGLNTLTSENSGAFMSEWYDKSGPELIEYLRGKSKTNLESIKEFLP